MMSVNKPILLFFLILLILPGKVLLCQNTNPGSQDTIKTYYEDEPVVITATRLENTSYRTPYSVDFLNQQEIQLAEPTISLSEALAGVPGLVIQNRQNQALGERITSRGIGSRAQFGVRGMKILVDNIPLTLADGQAQTSNIDLGSTEQIEVIRGPSSSLYGNAAGGVIQLKTQILEQQQPLRLEVKGTAGSYNLRKWQAKALGNGKNYHYTLNLSQTQSDGFRDHSAYKYLQFNSIAGYELTENLFLTGMLNYYNAPYLLNPSSLPKDDADRDPTKSRGFIVSQGAAEQPAQLQGGITGTLSLDNDDYIKLTLYGIRRTLINPIPGRIIDLERGAGGVRSSYHSHFTLATIPVRIVTGFDYEIQDDLRKEFINNGLPEGTGQNGAPEEIFNRIQYGDQLVNQDETVSGYGPFAQVEAAIVPKVRIQGGLRYDWYKFRVDDHLTEDEIDQSGTRIMEQLSPMVGINYLPYPNLSLYGNYSTAFQTPTSSELSNRPAAEGGFNPDLDPENIQSMEIGARGTLFSPGFRYNITAFTMGIEDMIIPFQIDDPTSEEVFHENAGAARNSGIEAFFQWRLSTQARWKFSYTFMHFVFQDYLVALNDDEMLQIKGNRVPGVPPHKIHTEFIYNHESGMYGEIQIQWMGEYFTNNFNGPAPGVTAPERHFINNDYSTVGLKVGNRFTLAGLQLSLFGGVDNLFDERYNASIVPNAFGGNYFEPAPGRHWYLGVTAGFTVP